MTSKELIERGLIWKNQSGGWSRNCPQCGSAVNHQGLTDRRTKDVCRKSHLHANICVICRAGNKKNVDLKPVPDGVWKDDMGFWCRTCPLCAKPIVHKGRHKNKNKHKCLLFFRKKSPCKKCSATQTLELPAGVHFDEGCWCRHCPTCNGIIKYQNGEWAKYTCIKGLRNKQVCKACSGNMSSNRQIGQKRSVEWCRNIGKSKLGDKNPWFGKKRSSEFSRLVSEANSGEKNPWFGKTQPQEMIHRRMLAAAKSKYQRKHYVLPDGMQIMVQGYEPQTLNWLLSRGITGIKTEPADMPQIMYEWQGKSRRYYPDCITDNWVVETKSPYTWFVDESRNIAKLRAAIMQGHNVTLFIWDRGNLLLKSEFEKNVEPVFPCEEALHRPNRKAA